MLNNALFNNMFNISNSKSEIQLMLIELWTVANEIFPTDVYYADMHRKITRYETKEKLTVKELTVKH